jgi:hypothetical protein
MFPAMKTIKTPRGPKGFRFGIHHRQSAGRDDFAAIFAVRRRVPEYSNAWT